MTPESSKPGQLALVGDNSETNAKTDVLVVPDVTFISIEDLRSRYDQCFRMPEKVVREYFRNEPIDKATCNQLLEIVRVDRAKTASSGSEAHTERSQYAENILVLAHSNMIYTVVSAFEPKRDIQYEDLVQEGYAILINAIRNANLSSRTVFNFRGYAVNTIKNKINDILLKQNVHLSPLLKTGARVAHARINGAIDEAASDGIILSDREVASKTGDHVSDVKYLRHRGPRLAAVSWEMIEIDDAPYAHESSPEEALLAKEHNQKLRYARDLAIQAMGELAVNPARAQLMELYFLSDERPSIPELARITGSSVPKVKSQIYRIRVKLQERLADQAHVLADD